MMQDFLLFCFFIAITFFSLAIRYFYVEESLLCYACKQIKPSYDYIIVGAGSAGSVVAKRLSENSTYSVLLLEAGSKFNNILSIPSAGLMLQESDFDWRHKTTKQKNACHALKDHKCKLPQGKIVGGSHMLNNLIYTRGHVDDFQDWFQDMPGYDYFKDVLPYFKRAEQFAKPNEDGVTTAPIYLNYLSYFSSLTDTMLDAFRKMGYLNNVTSLDFFGGFFKPYVNIRRGQRWTTAHHLLQTKIPNLSLITRAQVLKILFRNKFEAYAVQVDYYGNKYFIRANKAIIVCAGAIGSPHLLMLSGIGPKDHLSGKGIKVVKDLPVGNNLQDHPITGFDMVLLNSSINLGMEEFVSPYSLWQYFVKGKGPWTTQGCELIGFTNYKYIHCKNNIKNTESQCLNCMHDQPQIEFMFLPVGVSVDRGVRLKHFLGITDHIWDNYFDKINETSVSIMTIILHPKSRGTVRLLNKNPNSKPLVDPNYLSHPHDMDSFQQSFQMLKKVTNTEPMRKKFAKLNTIPFPGCENLRFDSFCYWKCYLKYMTMSCYHLSGTCKMGLEQKGGVVDFNFRVHGTNKLFVVDSSVLPSLPSGHINGPVVMLAERASDAIKEFTFMETSHSVPKDVFKPNI